MDRTHPSRTIDEEVALRAIVEGTARATGESFFEALVENLAKALNTHAAWVTRIDVEKRTMRALAFWLGNRLIENFEMPIDGTPCEVVIAERRLVLFPDNVIELFPIDKPFLQGAHAVSYMGVPLLDLNDDLMGHLAVLDQQPMPPEPRFQALFEIFAGRAAAEMRRLRAEAELREREEKLRALVQSAMDAIIELDHDLNIRSLNAAAEKVFGCTADVEIGKNFLQFLSPDSCRKLTLLTHDLLARPEGEQYLWIPAGLEAIKVNGKQFPAEASLSSYQLHRRTFYTLILRNVDDRLNAERKIQQLTVETEYLREELDALQNFGEILGQSDALRAVLRDVGQVAPQDTTVLIVGETGTGKELFARAIHAASPRRDRPLIKVNCAAIPASLMESEFFGHEAGAFTGATKKREGRFELAHQGTIFLDEIGELSSDLQAKLLRVLQEGEFEPVGSSRTKKVDVRVIAATNRNLEALIREGKFREDLYYRINVFPIRIPALRERGDDVLLLARSFAERFAQKMGRQLKTLNLQSFSSLKEYHWPGNVRELQNIVERAVITSVDGHLNLNRAISKTHEETPVAATVSAAKIYSAVEIEEIERRNLLRALETTGWRIAGKEGAAAILGLKPSTLTSRMKALGIQRPRPS